MNDKDYFFCGIGGSGMLPLAVLVKAAGGRVAGSDRALDQGRGAGKFDWLRSQGIAVSAQDGSGVVSADQVIVASAAIEDSVPDIARAKALGCARVTRAELLAKLFNARADGIAIGGTSGKSTVTGMIGWILAACGRDPTIMNGAVMKNFVSDAIPFASARAGSGPFVTEVDESDGSIALFRPGIAVINNISLDHKTLDELRALFGGFARAAGTVIWNRDDAETAALMASLDLADSVSFGFGEADVRAIDIDEQPVSARFTLCSANERIAVTLAVPGRHNIANALAAIAAAKAAGVPLVEACRAIESFTGLARRFDVVGGAGGITVIDDFGHNPDKIAATLRTLRTFPGRIIAFFQPHGYGPLAKMGEELAATFANELGPEDRLIVSDPAYFGGTVDRSIGSEVLTAPLGDRAEHIADRAACGERIVALAQPGDRIVVMGARDDTLGIFAHDILAGLAKESGAA
ncbi:UDP-N-acetylmuramate--alanine ligase [Sphingorhabdus soli]|uniref:UDP-N-acetylmuramate--alanine ligase n=1 Tax=Flavisphingopyxis soli TaxID=2601267 RepID=A0A5C6U7F5_9SPHN|nr:Mur ligase family protein [Sphingorhabdus soli]TXC68887.1 UDP-N-acetylmuramate--alanine ligase [Sphingorhabdus soli]